MPWGGIVAFVGAGSMASALINGLLAADKGLTAERVRASDPRAGQREAIEGLLDDRGFDLAFRVGDE